MSALARELDEWAKVSFDELKVRLKEDCVYQRGEGSSQYQVEVVLLESTPEYVNVSIGVDQDGWRPVSENFLVFRDGRVDRPQRRGK